MEYSEIGGQARLQVVLLFHTTDFGPLFVEHFFVHKR
jgi:hypothetical protein